MSRALVHCKASSAGHEIGVLAGVRLSCEARRGRFKRFAGRGRSPASLGVRSLLGGAAQFAVGTRTAGDVRGESEVTWAFGVTLGGARLL